MYLLLPVALFAAAAAPAEEAEIVTRSFDLSGFHAVDNAGPYEVTVRRGAAFSIEAKGPREMLDRLTASVEQGTLRLGWRGEKDERRRRRDIPTTHIAVTLPAIDAATLSGAGRLDIDRIDGSNVALTLSGAGNLVVDRIASQRLTMTLKGAGKIAATGGSAGDVTALLRGAGSVDTQGVAARDAKVELTGVGNIRVRASGSADVAVSGIGNARITGTTDCRIREHDMGKASCAAR